MYFRYLQTANMITLANDFADLISIAPNGDVNFVFTYTIDAHQALQRGASHVAVTVFSRYSPVPSLLGATQRGIVDTAALVDNIRSMLPDAKQSIQQRNSYIVAAKNNDLTSKVNNEVLQQVMAQVPPASIPQLNSPKLKVVQSADTKQANNPQPLLERVTIPDVQTALSSSIELNPRAVMEDMISRQGIDPSHILNMTPRSQDAVSVRGGLSNTQTALEKSTDPASKLLNFHLFPPTSTVPPTTTDQLFDNDLVTVLTTVTTTTTEVSVPVTVPRGRLTLEGSDITNLFVQFDLINTKSGEPIDTVIQALNFAKELQVYNTPIIPPIVSAAIAPAGTHAVLRIKQLDPGATSVQVFKKMLYVASSEIDEYTLVGTYSVTAGGEAIQVQVDNPYNSAVIYRVVPLGSQDTQSFEYTNVVIKPAHYTPIRAVALTGIQVNQGIQLQVRNIPSKCVAIELLKWNKTTHEADPIIVNGDVEFIDNATRTADLVTVTDVNVFSNNVYRYVVRVIYVEGITEDFGDVTLEFVLPAPGLVGIAVTNIVVSNDIVPDVSFIINSSTNSTDMDNIKQMLGQQDLQQFFQGDIQNQREQLQQLIAFNVHRVDLTTGARESFGTVTDANFVDSTVAKSHAVKPLQYGHNYRYEIYPLLRSPETLFSSFVKPAIDRTTFKPFTFHPSKFLHPLALTRGVLVSSEGALQRYAKDPMSFGIVGSVTTVKASFDNASARVIGQAASTFNRNLNIVSWQVQGDMSQVDHFLITKVTNGVRALVGKAHSEFPYGACQYFHQVTKHDNGSISYVITPIMNSYQVGQPVATNAVIVDAP